MPDRLNQIREPNRICLLLFVGVSLNIAGYSLNHLLLKTPLFMDSIGTILSAAILGPWLGAGVGLLSNLILGLFSNPVNIPFGVVNAAIGLIVGGIVWKYGFDNFRLPLITGLILGIACAVIATPMAVYFFGGVTGGYMDKLINALIQSGSRIFTSVFIIRMLFNVLDKLIGCCLVFVLLRWLPIQWRGIAISPGWRESDERP